MTEDAIARLRERIERLKERAPDESDTDFFIADYEVETPAAPAPAVPRPWQDVERGDDQ